MNDKEWLMNYMLYMMNDEWRMINNDDMDDDGNIIDDDINYFHIYMVMKDNLNKKWN